MANRDSNAYYVFILRNVQSAPDPDHSDFRFNASFETIAGFDDFAQKIHFNGDLVCKVELGGK